MASGKPILALEDLTNLLQSGLASEPQQGVRRLHRRRTHRSSDIDSQNIPLDPVPTLPPNNSSSNDSEAFVKIPENLISKATLLHVGLSEARARYLWERWTNWPPGSPAREVDEHASGLVVYFADFVVGHIGKRGSEPRDAWGDDDGPWWQCLEDNYGLDHGTAAAIMDPLFRPIRLTNTAAFWARDTVAARYASLEEIQRASQQRAAHLKLGQTTASASQASASAPGDDPAAPGTGFSSVVTTGTMPASDQHASPSIRAAREIAAQNAPGHTILYRGMDKARAADLFADSGAVAHLGAIARAPPGDFSGNRSMYDFTPQFAVAEWYAAYAKRRDDCGAAVVLAIHVPNAAIEALAPPDIQTLHWPADDWAKLIWHCRRNEMLPEKLRTYRQAILVIGTIAAHPNKVYHRMPSPECIGERDILVVPGPDGPLRAVQYAISGEDEGMEWLWENGVRTAMMLPFSKGDLLNLAEEQMPGTSG